MLTKDQFTDQFKHRVNINGIKNIIVKDSLFQGVQIYRALEKLLIQKADGWYISSL